MANIQLISAEEIAEMAASGGTEELHEFKEDTFNIYLTRFLAHKANLEKIKIDTSMSSQVAFNEQLSTLSKLTNIVHTYPSSKGGAYVLPQEQINEMTEQLKKQAQQSYNQERNSIQQWANKAYQAQDITRISLNIMRDVYNLRQDIVGTTEKFALMYRGAKNVISTIEVDISTFFTVLLNNPAINLQTSDNIMDYGLRFNNSVMRNLLKNGAFGKGQNLDFGSGEYELAKFYRSQRDALTIREKTFAELNKTELRWAGYDKNGNYTGNIKQGIEDKQTGILRIEGGKYWIVAKKNASGFVAQEIFNMSKNGGRFNPIADTVDWYLGGDVTSGNTEYSVKSFLEHAPSLVTINSLFTVVNRILTVLISQKNKDINTIRNTLKSYVFKAAEPIAAASAEELDSLLAILGI